MMKAYKIFIQIMEILMWCFVANEFLLHQYDTIILDLVIAILLSISSESFNN